jgi:hypothetical protein
MKAYNVEFTDEDSSTLETLCEQFKDAGINISVEVLISRLALGFTPAEIKEYELSKRE